MIAAMKVPSPELHYDCTKISTSSTATFDLGFKKGEYLHPVDKISTLLGITGEEASNQCRNFKSSIYAKVRFASSKVRCGGTVYSDRVTTLTGGRSVDVIRSIDLGRGRVECGVRVIGD